MLARKEPSILSNVWHVHLNSLSLLRKNLRNICVASSCLRNGSVVCLHFSTASHSCSGVSFAKYCKNLLKNSRWTRSWKTSAIFLVAVRGLSIIFPVFRFLMRRMWGRRFLSWSVWSRSGWSVSDSAAVLSSSDSGVFGWSCSASSMAFVVSSPSELVSGWPGKHEWKWVVCI